MLRRVLVVLVALVVVVLVGCLGAAGAAFAAGDANEAFCPGETEASPGFRGYLPDCRAYEMVTPSFKGGDAFAEDNNRFDLVAPDGSAALIPSLGAVAEAENDQVYGGSGGGTDRLGAIYLMTRTGAGWSTRAVDIPASRFLTRGLVSTSTDLSRTAWTATEYPTTGAPLPQRLYVREPGGEVVEVGLTAREQDGKEENTNVVGADAELHTILLSAENHTPTSLWEGDTTVHEGRSLYAYTGRHQVEPKMVGVMNEGELQSNAQAIPITACGTELGSGVRHSEYDAISDDGEAIFFTALGESACPSAPSPSDAVPKVNELYVRLGGEKTLGISEPGAGSWCDEVSCGVAAVQQPGVFQGASSDGSKVFFTSTQPLVDHAVAGEANLYEAEIEKAGLQSRVSNVVLLGSGVSGVARVSADGSRVYFVSTQVLSTNENSEEEKPVEGEENLYVYDTTNGAASPVYIATLAPNDEADWQERDIRPVQASLSDGRFLVFLSRAPLAERRHSHGVVGLKQLFEYDAQTAQLTRVSIGQNGAYNNDGAIQKESEQPKITSQVFSETTGESQALARSQNLSVTEDGRVFFTSKARLTPLALQGYGNVYEYAGGNIYLVSDGRDTALNKGGGSVVEFISTTSSGGDAFFQTADSLVPQDGDTQADVYDARENGGFPAPVSPVECESDGCQGPLGAAPVFPGAGSATGETGGNLPAPVSKPAVKTKAKAKPLSRAQQLAKALKACRGKQNKRKRAVCEAQARKRYGASSRGEVQVKHSIRRGN